MAADSNTGFHQRTAPSSFYNRHMVSFQSGEAGNSARMIPTGMDGFVGVSSTPRMLFTGGNPGVISDTAVLIPGRNTASCFHLDPVLGLQDSTGLAVDWSSDEQTLLEEGLVKYSNEPNIMRYIKIAAMLKNKTVRDVALRCRWMTDLLTMNISGFFYYIKSEQEYAMAVGKNEKKKETGKRRKQEEYYAGKKIKDKKDKQGGCSLKTNIVSSQLPNSATCSPVTHHMDSRDGISCEAPIVDGATRCLLEENAQLLRRIINNLDTSKLQNNVNLFFHVKNNVASILNRMSEMPGMMSQMPPLPVSINEELVGSILRGAFEALLFGTSSSIHLKQEPRC